MVTNLSAGKNIEDFNVIIEISENTGEVKYEYDKQLHLLCVDRFMTTAMRYPCNYGFVPNTLAEDGDPVDVLVMTPYPVQPGSLLRVRGVGLLKMSDESGKDNKILAVPIRKICCHYEHIQSLNDFPRGFLDIITHFFQYYKDLDPDKSVHIDGWEDKEMAEMEFERGVKRFQPNSNIAWSISSIFNPSSKSSAASLM